jgi:hypothetical protein
MRPATMTPTMTSTAPQFRATVVPEVWIRDHAVPVDQPELGDHEWTPTILPDEALLMIVGESCIDRDDALLDDPNAPEWLRQWPGPFTITVHRVA